MKFHLRFGSIQCTVGFVEEYAQATSLKKKTKFSMEIV